MDIRSSAAPTKRNKLRNSRTVESNNGDFVITMDCELTDKIRSSSSILTSEDFYENFYEAKETEAFLLEPFFNAYNQNLFNKNGLLTSRYRIGVQMISRFQVSNIIILSTFTGR